MKRLTRGIGVDRAIDAVGVDAEPAVRGPAAEKSQKQQPQFQQELKQVAPETHPKGNIWKPGQAPSQVAAWAVESLAKAGTLAIIGVYPPTAQSFPLGKAMNKNLTLQMGNCHHRRYIPELIELTKSGQADPEQILTRQETLSDAIAAYEAFDQRRAGWIKVELVPEREAEPETRPRWQQQEAPRR